MVAITVILAAVIGTFVVGLGDQVQTTTPQAKFTFDFQHNADSDDSVTVVHDGGDTISAEDTLTVSSSAQGTTPEPWGGTGSISAGSSTVYTLNTTTGSDSWSGETVRVVWTSQSGENSATLGKTTAPTTG